MGLFNSYGELEIQLKIDKDSLTLKHYSIGEKVSLDDGIYIGFEGAIVIKDGVFIAEFDSLTDKWGNSLSCQEIIGPESPLLKALDALGVPKQKKKKN